MYEKILVPLDGSEFAKKALDHAEILVKTFNAEITLFQVVPLMPMHGYTETVVPPIIDERSKQSAERYLRDAN